MPMDICSRIGLSATDNINDHHGCKNALRSTHGALKPLSVDELSVDMTKFLNIQDPIEEDSSALTTPRNGYDNFHHPESESPKTCISKRAPSSGKTLSLQDIIVTSESSRQGDNIKSNDPSGSCSLSLPTTHLKPVSAMKGSREKRGETPPVKLTVKWAPDVYDPIPTSVTHIVTNNRSKHSKKSSKNKQKHGSKSSSSSSSRGSKSKEKKQVRKRSSSMGMSYKFEEFIEYHEQDEHEAGEFDIHDRLCGSSFIKKYGTSLHISSVAEAT